MNCFQFPAILQLVKMQYLVVRSDLYAALSERMELEENIQIDAKKFTNREENMVKLSMKRRSPEKSYSEKQIEKVMKPYEDLTAREILTKIDELLNSWEIK